MLDVCELLLQALFFHTFFSSYINTTEEPEGLTGLHLAHDLIHVVWRL